MATLEKAQKTAQRAFILMEKHGFPATGPNLLAWYVYADGSEPNWNRRLDQLVANRAELGEQKVEEAICQYMLGHIGCRAIFDGVNGLFSTVKDVTVAVSEAERDAQQYGFALAEARNDFVVVPVPPPLQHRIDALLALTEAMLRKQEELVGKLSASSQRIGLLRNRLEETHRRAITDPLTDLVTEKYFFARLREMHEEASQMGQDLSLAIIRLDHFSDFCALHGAETGDSVLRLVAGILAKSTRETDVAGRIGTDEFGLVFQRTRQEDAHPLVERVRNTVASRSLVNRGTSKELGTLTFSAGVASHKGGETVEAMTEAARAAIRAAQREGGNRVLLAS